MSCEYCFYDGEDAKDADEFCVQCCFPLKANERVQKHFRMDQLDLEHDLWEIRNLRRFWMAFAGASLLFALLGLLFDWRATLFFLLNGAVFFVAFRQHQWRYQWFTHLGVLLFYVLMCWVEFEMKWSPIYGLNFCLDHYGQMDWQLSSACNLLPILYLAFRLLILVALVKGVYKTVIHRKMGQRIAYIISIGREMKDSNYYKR